MITSETDPQQTSSFSFHLAQERLEEKSGGSESKSSTLTFLVSGERELGVSYFQFRPTSN